MQRLHERDLTGHLLERSGWTHLCLPARYEPRHPFVWPDDPRTLTARLTTVDGRQPMDAVTESLIEALKGAGVV